MRDRSGAPRFSGGAAAVEHLAGRRGGQRRENGEQRGFARAVRTEQADDLAGAAVERHARQRPAAPEIPAELADGEIEKVDAHAAALWPPSASRSR